MSDLLAMCDLYEKMSDKEILIAAGLLTGSENWTDGLYIKWIIYEMQIKARRLTWDAARRAAARFKKQTGYPKQGWKNKYMANDESSHRQK